MGTLHLFPTSLCVCARKLLCCWVALAPLFLVAFHRFVLIN